MTTGWRTLSPTLSGFPGVPQASIKAPANLVAFADSAQIDPASDPNINTVGATACNLAAPTAATCGPFTQLQPLRWVANGRSAGWDFDIPGTGFDYGGRTRRPHFRHQQKCNVAFADGHVKSVGPDGFVAQVGTAQDIWHNWGP